MEGDFLFRILDIQSEKLTCSKLSSGKVICTIVLCNTGIVLSVPQKDILPEL